MASSIKGKDPPFNSSIFDVNMIVWMDGVIFHLPSNNKDDLRVFNLTFLLTNNLTHKIGMLATKNNKFLNIEIEDDSKIVIYYYNKKNSIPSSTMLLIEDVWKLFHL